MTMDTDPSTPQTPEPAQPTDPACPAEPAEPASSRVTINLRNANPSSPASPTPQNPGESKLADGLDGSDDQVKLSVENTECEMKSPEVPNGDHAAASLVPASPAGLSESGSPDIEVVDVPDDDEDVTIGDGEPEVSIISEVTRAMQDPTLEFPYNDGEPLMETVTRLVQYLSNRKLVPLRAPAPVVSSIYSSLLTRPRSRTPARRHPIREPPSLDGAIHSVGRYRGLSPDVSLMPGEFRLLAGRPGAHMGSL